MNDPIWRLLPGPLMTNVFKTLGKHDTEGIEEIRLRVGREVLVRCDGLDYACGGVIRQDLLRDVLAKASEYSAYSYEEPLRAGWLPLAGGVRIGVAARISGDGLRDISSLAIRRPYSGTVWSERDFLDGYPDGFQNTVILSPPGYGKTTLLRDLIRHFSLAGMTIGVADDRYEIGSVWKGTPAFDLGPRTDIISGGSKRRGAMMLLRSMAPDLIAFDEITDEEDVRTAMDAAFLGVGLLSTAHARDVSDLNERPHYRMLTQAHVFERAVVIRMEEGKRKYRVEKL